MRTPSGQAISTGSHRSGRDRPTRTLCGVFVQVPRASAHAQRASRRACEQAVIPHFAKCGEAMAEWLYDVRRGAFETRRQGAFPDRYLSSARPPGQASVRAGRWSHTSRSVGPPGVFGSRPVPEEALRMYLCGCHGKPRWSVSTVCACEQTARQSSSHTSRSVRGRLALTRRRVWHSATAPPRRRTSPPKRTPLPDVSV